MSFVLYESNFKCTIIKLLKDMLFNSYVTFFFNFNNVNYNQMKKFTRKNE